MFRLRLLIITIVSFIFSSSAISQTKEEIDAAVNQVYSFLNQFNDSLPDFGDASPCSRVRLLV